MTSGSTNTTAGQGANNSTASGNESYGSGSNSSDNDYKSMMVSGTVTGNSIQGSITCTKSNGMTKKYSFTGSIADQKDLDNDKEMGMK